ncbi:MAG TPA: VCBS repeat-containing protein [Bryobacteraceae bacterium]|nr:VCBS repeat-containing protein [Bryobacteraceae bacterium]
MSRWSLLFLVAGLLVAQPGIKIWETKGFEAFRQGEFDAGGANLYVSRNGVVETVHRFDVNHDGYYDLIFNNTHDLSYVPPSYEYRFRGAGRNGQQIAYPGAGAVRVRVADLNGDGFPELVIARGFDNSTRVMNSWIYWGAKDGWNERFHSEVSTPYVQDACIADLNHDGRADLIFIASSGVGMETSYAYWGREKGYFYRARTGFETPGANGCATGDLDGDGVEDLVVTASGKNGKIFWSGKLRDPAPLPLEGGLGAAVVGRRLVLATAQGPRIYSARNRAFQLEQSLALEHGGRVAVGDLNHDGMPDLVVTRAVVKRQWETSSRVYWGKPGGQFDEAAHLDLPTVGAVDAAIGDIDGDGFADLAFANSRSDLQFDIDSYVYWGGADGLRAGRRSSLPTHGAQGVAIAGGSVFFANSTKGRPIGDIDTYIYFGSKDGSYSTDHMQRLPTIGGYESCIADLNDDGYTDLLLVGSHEGDAGGTAGSYIYWGAKDGLAASRRSEVPTRGAIGCAIGDLDRDGYLDLLFSNMEDDTAQILFGSAQGFRREQNLPVKGPRFPAIADLNKDGSLDLLVPSLKDGLVIFWGSATGFQAGKRTALESVGLVSEQVADLDQDGWLDIILCNLMDVDHWFYRGIHSQIYWGSPHGYSAMRRSELPSTGTHHAVVADFNHDGSLDIFLSDYQSEFTRSIDSFLYWGNREANYSIANRQALHNESAAGVVAADLNGDGWADLAVSNHVQNGDHHAKSLIFWNQAGKFDERRTTSLPTIGPHMMTGVDVGNLYTRALEETYTSAAHDAGAPVRAAELTWEGTTPFDSQLTFEVRGADSREGLRSAAWQKAGSAERRRWWQYRARFHGGRAAWPTLQQVNIRWE